MPKYTPIECYTQVEFVTDKGTIYRNCDYVTIRRPKPNEAEDVSCVLVDGSNHTIAFLTWEYDGDIVHVIGDPSGPAKLKALKTHPIEKY